MNPIADAYINEEFPLNLFESWDVVARLFESIEDTYVHTCLAQCQDISVVVAHQDVTIGVSHVLCA